MSVSPKPDLLSTFKQQQQKKSILQQVNKFAHDHVMLNNCNYDRIVWRHYTSKWISLKPIQTIAAACLFWMVLKWFTCNIHFNGIERRLPSTNYRVCYLSFGLLNQNCFQITLEFWKLPTYFFYLDLFSVLIWIFIIEIINCFVFSPKR